MNIWMMYAPLMLVAGYSSKTNRTIVVAGLLALILATGSLVGSLLGSSFYFKIPIMQEILNISCYFLLASRWKFWGLLALSSFNIGNSLYCDLNEYANWFYDNYEMINHVLLEVTVLVLCLKEKNTP